MRPPFAIKLDVVPLEQELEDGRRWVSSVPSLCPSSNADTLLANPAQFHTWILLLVPLKRSLLIPD